MLGRAEEPLAALEVRAQCPFRDLRCISQPGCPTGISPMHGADEMWKCRDTSSRPVHGLMVASALPQRLYQGKLNSKVAALEMSTRLFGPVPPGRVKVPCCARGCSRTPKSVT